MSSSTIVLFDLGNVLVSIQPGSFTRALGIDPQVAYRKYQTRIVNIVRRYERGERTTDEYLEDLSALFDGQFERHLLRDAMMEVIGEPKRGMEDLVRRVAAKHQTGLVSNTNELHYEYSKERFPILSALRHHFVSYRLGTLKPEEAFYRHVIRVLSCPPAQLVFIDDLVENVEGANASGMHGIRFTDAGDLEKKLHKLRVL